MFLPGLHWQVSCVHKSIHVPPLLQKSVEHGVWVKHPGDGWAIDCGDTTGDNGELPGQRYKNISNHCMASSHNAVIQLNKAISTGYLFQIYMNSLRCSWYVPCFYWKPIFSFSNTHTKKIISYTSKSNFQFAKEFQVDGPWAVKRTNTISIHTKNVITAKKHYLLLDLRHLVLKTQHQGLTLCHWLSHSVKISNYYHHYLIYNLIA